LYTYANLIISPIFSKTDLGIVIKRVCSLVLIPIVIASIPALLYRIIKGHNMPYFIHTTWVLWFIIVISKVLIQ
jgi:hypothetical protein